MSRLVRSWGSSGWYRFALLIVDDKVAFRDEVQALLEEQGICVVGGTEAISQVRELRPDVVLIDIDLR